MKTRITEMLGIKYPILQGAMAWVSDYKLVSAVSEAGGLGILASGNAPASYIREQIAKVKERTDKPFGVNIMMLSPHVDEVVKAVAEEGVKVVTTGAGSPQKYMEVLKAEGIKVIPVVASCHMAEKAERLGADAVVAEGREAGGHIGSMSTMTLVPQVVDTVSIPVIAAGGIADERGIGASFMLGAAGVQLGTRFICTKDCGVHKGYKDSIIAAVDTDTTVTGESVGRPVRALKNLMTDRYIEMEKERASRELLEEITLGSLKKAAVDGDVEGGSVMAGQIAGMIKDELWCREFIGEVFLKTVNLLNKNADYFM